MHFSTLCSHPVKTYNRKHMEACVKVTSGFLRREGLQLALSQKEEMVKKKSKSQGGGGGAGKGSLTEAELQEKQES